MPYSNEPFAFEEQSKKIAKIYETSSVSELPAAYGEAIGLPEENIEFLSDAFDAVELKKAAKLIDALPYFFEKANSDSATETSKKVLYRIALGPVPDDLEKAKKVADARLSSLLASIWSGIPSDLEGEVKYRVNLLLADSGLSEYADNLDLSFIKVSAKDSVSIKKAIPEAELPLLAKPSADEASKFYEQYSSAGLFKSKSGEEIPFGEGPIAIFSASDLLAEPPVAFIVEPPTSFAAEATAPVDAVKVPELEAEASEPVVEAEPIVLVEEKSE